MPSNGRDVPGHRDDGHNDDETGGSDSNDDAGCIENRLTLIISNLGPAIKRYI